MNRHRVESYFWAALILIVGLSLRLGALSAWPSLHHADEDFQMLEQAHRYAFGYGVIPWEFEDGIRSPLPPILLGYLYRISEDVIGKGPRVYITAARASLSLLSLAGVLALYVMGLRKSQTHAIIGGLVAATWFELVYFSFRPLLEAVSLDFLLMSLAIVTYRTRELSRTELAALGFLLATTVMLRLQFAPAIICVVAFARRRNPESWMRPVALGASVPSMFFGAADWVVWGYPFHSQIAAVHENIFQGVASTYGVQSISWYFSSAFALYGIVFFAFAALLLFASRQIRPWLWVGFSILFVHSLIPHKEYRFVFGGYFCLIFAAAMTSADLCVRLQAVGLSPRQYRQTVGMVCLAWLGVSAYLATSEAFIGQWNRNGVYVEAATYLSDRQDICGILMYNQPTTGYVFLHHKVPVYMSRYNHLNVTEPGQAISAPDWSAFNFIVASRRVVTLLDPRYHLLSCMGTDDPYDPCVMRRDGPCLPTTRMVALLGQRHFGRASPTT